MQSIKKNSNTQAMSGKEALFSHSRLAKQNAVKILGKVFSEKLTIEQAMELILEGADVRSKSAQTPLAWYRDIVAGVIRFKPYLDEILETLSLNKKPTGKLLRYLYCGAYPLLFQEHSQESCFKIVNEWVDAIKTDLGLPPSKFANALLRKITTQSQEWKKSIIVTAQKSFPKWINEEICIDGEIENANLFARAVLERPENWLRNENSQEPKKLSGLLEEDPDFSVGKVIVQDIASQKVVEEVSKLLPKGCSVLDLCSAPGGKSIGLVWNGFRVTSTDLNSKRLITVYENRERLKLVEKWEIKDFKEIENESRKWDALWIDAPCTGTGVLRRHPEISYIKDEKTKKDLQQTQRDLLGQVNKYMGKTGFLIYSVCSILPSEGQNQVQQFLVKNRQYKLLKELKLGYPQLECDGFYAAIMLLQ